MPRRSEASLVPETEILRSSYGLHSG